MTFRTTLREIRRPRQIPLIALPGEKYARRILAIVSTTSIPIEAPNRVGGQSGPVATGSRLDAHQPRSGVPIPCKMTPTPFYARTRPHALGRRDGPQGWSAEGQGSQLFEQRRACHTPGEEILPAAGQTVPRKPWSADFRRPRKSGPRGLRTEKSLAAPPSDGAELNIICPVLHAASRSNRPWPTKRTFRNCFTKRSRTSTSRRRKS